jgi:hypothetical protein
MKCGVCVAAIIVINVTSATYDLHERRDKHQNGQNCSAVFSDSNQRRIEAWGCEGLTASYTAALLSSLSYLDYSVHAPELPLELQMAYDKCIHNPKLMVGKGNIGAEKIAVIPRNRFIKWFRRPLEVGAQLKEYLKRISSALALPLSFAANRKKVAPVNSIHMLWFFSDWSDGMLHDTEVLVAEGTDQVYIIFRGSDSTADVITSSQTYVPARHFSYFANCTEGSLHRGILNAYSAVHSGALTKLYREGSILHAEFNAIFEEVYSKCQKDRQGRASNSSSTCSLSGVLLSTVLVRAVVTALRHNTKVTITGHSLGGALATLLALDIAINNHTDAYSGKQVKTSTRWVMPKVLTKTAALPTANPITDPLDNMNLIVFGDPEVADAVFVADVLKRHSQLRRFIQRGAVRYVSLSRSPYCNSDVVTGSMSLATSIFGDIIMGRGGGFVGRARARARERGSAQAEKKPTSEIFMASIADGTTENGILSSGSGATKTQGYFFDPIYLCSGYADSGFSAHRMAHFLQGMSSVINTGEMFTCKAVQLGEESLPWSKIIIRSFSGSRSSCSINNSSSSSHYRKCNWRINLPLNISKRLFLYPGGGCYEEASYDSNIFFYYAC